MLWVAAARYTAEMVDLVPLGDRADMMFVHHTMNPNGASRSI